MKFIKRKQILFKKRKEVEKEKLYKKYKILKICKIHKIKNLINQLKKSIKRLVKN